MRTTHRNRLKKVSAQIEAIPISSAVKEAAFERFRQTGELPEYTRLAATVVHRS